jgi:hypothetical protein
MKVLTKIGIGLAVVLGTTLAFSKNNRFVGDKAQKGDTVTVPLAKLALTPAARALIGGTVGATDADFLVTDDSDPDTLKGTLTQLSAGNELSQPNAAVVSAVGTVTVNRADVTGVGRDGQAIT